MNATGHKRTVKPAPVVFESDDTEGSDLSYESSVEMEDEVGDTTKKVQMFKEEMTRFFINHPQLKHNELFQPNESEVSASVEKKGLWGHIASDILGQSRKHSQLPSIQAFAQRLNLYRSKVERVELIDLILKQKSTLLKQIEADVARKRKTENSIHNSIQEKLKKETGDVTYYSWRKNKQLEFRIDKAEQVARSLHKQPAVEKENTNNRRSKTPNLEVGREFRVPNLEPKTEAGKQLQDELRKCPDEYAAKRTLINFLVKHHENTAKQFASKPSLLQQGQKYYSEESKEFVLLYPNPHVKKKLEGELTKQKLQNMDLEDDAVSCSFMKILGKMAVGTLMRHWKSKQDCQL